MSVKRETVAERKALPLASGVLDYFPDALLVVAEVSRVGNEQHHPGEPLHWDKSKSTDEADALLRHLLDRGTYDTDGLRHSGKVAWRALALLQRELDAEAAVKDPDRLMTTDEFNRWTQEQMVQRTIDQLNDPLGPRISMASAMEKLGIDPIDWQSAYDGDTPAQTPMQSVENAEKRGDECTCAPVDRTWHDLGCALFMGGPLGG